MKKGNGKIMSLEINDALKEWNDSNDTERASLSFSYVADNDEEENGVLALLMQATSHTYSLIIDLQKIGMPLEKAQKALVGQVAPFVTYVFTISELTNGEHSVVHGTSRDYTNFSVSYIDTPDAPTEETAREAVKSSLNKGLDSGLYSFEDDDEDDDEEEEKSKVNQHQNRHNRR